VNVLLNMVETLKMIRHGTRGDDIPDTNPKEGSKYESVSFSLKSPERKSKQERKGTNLSD